MRAVVIGAGIVGLTSGIALRRAGIDVVVHEHAPEIRAAGAGLGLWANALRVFDELGIGEQVRAIGRPSEMYFHDPAGRLLDTPEFGAEDHQYLLVHRGKLTDLLADTVGRDNIRLATGFQAYDEHDDHVTVRFTDGTSENADVLVGADGAYSAVRAQLVPGFPAQEHPGHHVWRAVIPATGITVPDDRLILGHNRCRGGYVRTYDGHVYWLLNQFDSPPLTGTRKQQALERVDHLQEEGQNSLLADLIAATPEEQILQNQIMLVPPLPHWVSARVVLAGGAGHPLRTGRLPGHPDPAVRPRRAAVRGGRARAHAAGVRPALRRIQPLDDQPAAAASREARGAGMTFVVEVDVPVPMRDGVALATNVWRPEDQGPFPVLLVRTPYGKDDAGTFGNPKLPDVFALVEAGYAVVAQDVRGTSRSPGTFVPNAHEGSDGVDTLEWLAGQSWCDGAVGMWGGSYMGFTQWQAAVRGALALRAIAPVMSSADPYGAPWYSPGGALSQDAVLTWGTLSALRNLRRDLADGHGDP